MINFFGPARRLDSSDIKKAAERIDCEPAIIRAVIEVEAGGDGFLSDKRPKILFEAHVFSRLTSRRFDNDTRYQNVSRRIWNRELYGKGGAHQYERLMLAMSANEEAALQAASWGAFQVLGSNAKNLGYGDVFHFVDEMTRGEAEHLASFCAFVEAKKLAVALKKKKWSEFARGYNGPGYKSNRYDAKLEAAYGKYAGREESTAEADAADTAVEYAPNTRILRLGDKGLDVRALKKELNDHGTRPPLEEDDHFDERTDAAVREFQFRAGSLKIDGLVGPLTWEALNGELAEPESETMAPAAALGGFYEHYDQVDTETWDARYPNFTPEEIACRRDKTLLVDETAMDGLQALRDALGKPMTINSAYRSEACNAEIGGARASMHLKGRAFDVDTGNLNPAAFEALARQHGFRGFGFYPGKNFIHIDNREIPAEWGRRWWV